jgi:hypothetical protein
MLDNEKDFREATTSFDDGLLAVDSVIFNEGLRRALKLDDANGGTSAQTALENEARTLRLCKDSCQTPDEQCRDRADRGSDIVLATACDIRSAKCETKCTQALLNTVSGMPDLPITALRHEYEDPALEQQREEAVKAILFKDARDAQLMIEEGILDLQAVALEELIRINLAEYEHSGVPEGVTSTVAADNERERCITQVRMEDAECHRGSRMGGLGDLFIGALVCGGVSALQLLGCGAQTVKRVCPLCPQ